MRAWSIKENETASLYNRFVVYTLCG